MQENTAPQVVGLESHAFLRALPVALYLLFPYEDGKLGLEAIGNKQLHRGLKLLKHKPVVPGIGDLPLPLMHILHQLSAFLVAHGGSALWREDVRLPANHEPESQPNLPPAPPFISLDVSFAPPPAPPHSSPSLDLSPGSRVRF